MLTRLGQIQAAIAAVGQSSRPVSLGLSVRPSARGLRAWRGVARHHRCLSKAPVNVITCNCHVKRHSGKPLGSSHPTDRPHPHMLHLSTARASTSRAMAAAAAGAGSAVGAFSPRVLSVQSSVVHGYVGNKSAIFPLQLLGFDVDPVFSVQFSNHTGYPVVKGHVFDGDHLLQLLAGLRANGLICHTHLLSGYIGSQSLLEAVAAAARELRQANPALTYVCDPVLGDEGHLYVKPELVDSYRSQLLPLADLLTPNQFEAQLLSGLPVQTTDDALAAAAALHDRGPATVIITSMTPPPHPEYSPPPSQADAGQQQQQQQQPEQEQQQQQQEQQQQQPASEQPPATKQQEQQHYITLVASTRLPQQQGCPSRFLLRIPQLPGYFTGTGDLLAALLLAWVYRHPGNLAAAVEKAVAGLQGVLSLTAAAAGPAAAAAVQGGSASGNPDAAAATAAAFKAKELRLIQGQQLLVQPHVTIRAEPL